MPNEPEPTPPTEGNGTAPAERKGTHKTLARVAGYLIAGVLLASLGVVAARNWTAVQAHAWRVKPWQLAASFLVLAAARSMHALCVQATLRAFGKRVPLSMCWRVYFIPQFAKYVPGGVWIFLFKAYLYNRYGIARATVAVMLFVEQAALIAGAMVVFICSLPLFGVLEGSVWLWSCPVALVVLLAALHPRLVSWAYNLLHRRVDRGAEAVRVSYGRMLWLLAINVALWIVAGLAFCLMASSITDVPAGQWPPLMGMFAGASGLGFLVFVAPAGLGVREGGLAGFLSLLYPAGVAAAVALAARLWWLAVDVVLAGGSLLVVRLVCGPIVGFDRAAADAPERDLPPGEAPHP